MIRDRRSGEVTLDALVLDDHVSATMVLGHATIALTLDTCSHVIPSFQQEAASVVAAASTIAERASQGDHVR